MSIQIFTNNSIDLDHEPVKLADRSISVFVIQRGKETVVYSSNHDGSLYKEYSMPHAQYLLTHEAPLSGVPGLIQFEADIRAFLEKNK